MLTRCFTQLMDFKNNDMKKIILFLIFLITSTTYSQYDLQFSKVITMVLGSGQEATVPDGKVWKVESGYSGSINNNYMDVRIDNSEFSSGANVNAQFGFPSIWNSPLWLKAGDRVQGEFAGASFSIIEFNLVTAGSSGGGGSNGSGGGDSGSGGSGSGSSSGVSFNDNSGVPGDDFTDLDGNVYGTTNINGMIWTTSNYEGTTYSDGTPIPYISDWNEWKDATTGAYTYHTQDESLGYGKLYNVHAIRGRHDDDSSTPNKKIAPDGWHVPSYSEILYISNLYSSTASANSFSLKSQTDWAAGTNGSNISGLNFKPWPTIPSSAQFPNIDETYGFNSVEGFSSSSSILDFTLGYSTKIWSSTPYTSGPLQLNWVLTLEYYGQSLTAGYGNNTHLDSVVNGTYYTHYGAYVRLVKDY